MNTFLQLIQNISSRPAVYVGEVNLKLVRAHLSGYEQALLDTGELEDKYSLSSFTKWLQTETKTHMWWDGILLQVFGSEEDAINNLAKKYTEFTASL